MNSAHLDLLACPECGAALSRAAEALVCPAGHAPAGASDGAWPIRGGIPRLVPAGAREAAERTVEAFERQWRVYGGLPRLFGKSGEALRKNLHGARLSDRIDPAWYRGKRVLDAGCGHGRYLRAFADLGAEVVGLDLGHGPEIAGAPVDDPRITVVQGSVLAPPFQDAAFDLVFSDGVIHHTPDAAGAYARLARLVKPGGALYVWVYPEEGALREAVFGLARQVTTRLPGAGVRALSFALAPLTLFVRSYSGTKLGQATWAECAQVIHDWIAPPLQSHHDEEEVLAWAQAAGLTDAERLPIPTGVTAWRPA